MKLLGKEAEIIIDLKKGEKPERRGKPYREAWKRLEKRGLIQDGKLTREGKEEAQWRIDTISRTREVFDLEPGGGYKKEIHLVYEPVSLSGYAWNWCGKRGVSYLQRHPKREEAYFQALGKNFWIEGRPLKGDELNFNLPTPVAVEDWSRGARISKPETQLWERLNNYFQFFLDLREPCYYDTYTLTGFQTWLTPLLNSVWFLAAKGAYGGGKTVGGEALVGISRHGKTVSPSVAYLGRSLERLKITPFADEFDIVCEQNPELARIARMSQRRGQTYDRCTKSGVPQSFNVFGVWIMSVHGELERALASRTIPITTQETENMDIPVVNVIKKQASQQLYDEMWMWYMDSLDHIAYSTTSTEVDIVDVVDRIANTNNIGEARMKLAKALSSSLTPNQLSLLGQLAGRNVELMFYMYRAANVLRVNVDERIARAFTIKEEIEEEEREVGKLGLLRDFLVQLYKKRRELGNYWTASGAFMVSSKECFSGFNQYLHDHEYSGVSPHLFMGLLRELGFTRPTNRKKMKILTFSEIEAGEVEKQSRLANIYTPLVCRRLGIKVERPRKEEQRELPWSELKAWIIQQGDRVRKTDLAAKARELNVDPQEAVERLKGKLIVERPQEVDWWGVVH